LTKSEITVTELEPEVSDTKVKKEVADGRLRRWRKILVGIALLMGL
jgi:hypothetical protein